MGDKFTNLLSDLDAYRKLSDPMDKTMDEIIRLINAVMPFPDDKTEEYMQIVVDYILEFDIFEDVDQVLEYLRNTDWTDPQRTYIAISILFYFGREYSNVFRRLVRNDWFALIKSLFLQYHTYNLIAHNILRVMTAMCSVSELSLNELGMINEEFLTHVCDMIENTRHTEGGLNHALTLFLIEIHRQFQQKSGNLERRVINLLEKRSSFKTLSENVIFVLNRTDDAELQLSIVILVSSIFDSKLLATSFFYTNDIIVMIDVLVRELTRVSDQAETLQHAYLNLLMKMRSLDQIPHSSIKAIMNTCRELSQSHLVRPSTRRLAGRICATTP